MGSSESTGRSNGDEKEEERQPENSISPNLGAAAVAIGTAAVAAWGVSRMLSNNKSDNEWGQVKDEMHGDFKSFGLKPSFGGSTSSAPPRLFKLKTDGACPHPIQNDDGVLRGPSGYAGILEDDRGNYVRGFRGFIGVSDCLTAEIHGILKGLELLDKLGYEGSFLENDSQAAVEWVTGQNDGPGKRRIIRDCWELITKCKQLIQKNNITILRCFRGDNKDADKLASLAVHKGEPFVEFTDVHRELGLVLHDQSSSSFY